MPFSHTRRKGDAPDIIIAPPLTGCSTLASLLTVPPDFVIDYDRVPGFPTRGKPLHDRKSIFHDLARYSGARVICLPVLPTEDDLPLIQAIVIIPPGVFIRRLLAIPDSRYADGHRIAAQQWRDEAIRLCTITGINPHANLAHVPALARLSVGHPSNNLYQETRQHGQHK